MLDHKIGGLPVVDTDGNIIGMITESDVFKMLVKSRTKAIVAAE
jgi:CBS domain-containing protein